MKKLKFLGISLIALAGFFACQSDNDLEFIAQEPTEAISFTNTLSDNYVLSTETSDNIAERFVWNAPDFGVPTSVSYEVQGSRIDDFSIVDYTSGTISENNHGIKVSELLRIADSLGLDSDPNTEAGNEGSIHFRIRAFIGNDDATNATESKSDLVSLNITLLEEEIDNGGPNCPSIWVVGAGAADAGWNWDNPVEFLCTDNVYKTNINLVNDSFRFFLTRDDWNSGQNFPYYIGEGYTIDSRLEDALDGDNNFRFIGTPGKYSLTVDNVNKVITLGPPAAEEANCDSRWVVGAGAADAGWNWDNPIEFTCVDNVYSANINLVNDSFRFFLTRDDWNSGQNFPYYVGEGYTIDANFEDALDGDNNFRFIGTPGIYYLVVDTVNKVISLR